MLILIPKPLKSHPTSITACFLPFFFSFTNKSQLVDLKKDPLSANDLLGDGANPLGGILGAAFGQSAAEVQARVEEASKNAVDLTSLVRKKKAKDDDAVNGSGNTKRKADEETSELETKRTKVDEEEQTAEADK